MIKKYLPMQPCRRWATVDDAGKVHSDWTTRKMARIIAKIYSLHVVRCSLIQVYSSKELNKVLKGYEYNDYEEYP